MWLVKLVARKIYPKYKAYNQVSDLEQDGVIGLMDAMDKYDLSKEVEFETYAYYRIRGAILDGIRSRSPLPRQLVEKHKDDPPVINWESTSHMESVIGGKNSNVEHEIYIKEIRNTIQDSLRSLPKRQRLYILKSAIEGKSNVQISKEVNRDHTSVSSSKHKGINKLKHILRRKLSDDDI